MKLNLLQIVGAIVLLASMAFALFSLETADVWITRWLPAVIAGVGLVAVGTVFAVTKKRRDPHD